MRAAVLALCRFSYQRFAKPVFFRFDAERVHEGVVAFGAALGRCRLVRALGRALLSVHDPVLRQEIAGIRFENPIGLAAGFDYEARLPRVLPAIGFGFGTVGTLTSRPYAGNAAPRLGRLIRSRSLLVNKGFKNLGVATTLARLGDKPCALPIGVSIGVTNSPDITTQEAAIADIVAGFTAAARADAPMTHYELNISCPNLHTPVDFYAPARLDALLRALDALHLAKPVFVKMPIHLADRETRALLDVIAAHAVAGIIFGNLQKDRTDPSFVPGEITAAPPGNFSGKPTERRSNELIALAYRTYGKQLVIIGCGGVFSAEDAYEKIRRGASLVELITGLIFEGPQVIAEINRGLIALLKRDGFPTLAAAVGSGLLRGHTIIP
jgi:dihydroorotate dehydrogenase subfamily 2